MDLQSFKPGIREATTKATECYEKKWIEFRGPWVKSTAKPEEEGERDGERKGMLYRDLEREPEQES